MNHALVWSEPLLPKCIFLSSYKAGPNGFTFCNSVNCSPTIIIIICNVSWMGREEDADDDHFWRRSTRRENTLRWKVHFKSIQKNVSVQFQKPFDKNFVELPPKITLCCCNRTYLKHTYLPFVKLILKAPSPLPQHTIVFDKIITQEYKMMVILEYIVVCLMRRNTKLWVATNKDWMLSAFSH